MIPRYYFDAGNTRLKLWACDGDGEVIAESVIPHHGSLGAAMEILPEAFLQRPSVVLGATVLADETVAGFNQACLTKWGVQPRYAVALREQCGITNAYEDGYGKLGIDRWLAMLGCSLKGLASDDVACIVDCGTAITIDLLRGDGRHEGGYIIPGVGMMQQSLFLHTARVRHDTLAETSLAPGKSTAEAVTHGVMLAVTGLIEKVTRDRSCKKVVLTGGDAEKTGQLLAVEYCEEPLLLLKGMQRYFADAGIS